MERSELAGWLRLTLTPGVGDIAARKLLASFGLPEAIFDQPAAVLAQVVSLAQADALHRMPPDLEAVITRTLEWLGSPDDSGAVRRILTLGDPGYPAALLETADPPILLYVIGPPGLDLPPLPRSVAIVGSRNPTPQGLINARSFAKDFSDAGWCVVSGLAAGIDGAAHEGALEAAPRPDFAATVAVVGTGLDRVYPAKHRAMAHRIANRGLIVSEFALGTPPLNQNFPKRNRIIAGLSRGTLVIEAALQSGSLITARLATELGREVFAIPGSIHSPQSRGCHALIRQGAKLVELASDVHEEFTPAAGSTASANRSSEEGLRPSEVADAHGDASGLLGAIGYDPVSLDALCARTGFGAAELQARLLELELDGQLARLPGGLFQRTARC
ncbi:Rossmann fold nucleotide-binding protein Smf [Burkholderiales bacterium 8X]|nr:Rossmann fold nucleotide-binding protein Smf [Burkholderiales bacterium 8X]